MEPGRPVILRSPRAEMGGGGEHTIIYPYRSSFALGTLTLNIKVKSYKQNPGRLLRQVLEKTDLSGAICGVGSKGDTRI